MEYGQIVMWTAIVIGGAATLYGLHRFCLWLEQEEWICYIHRKPSGGGGGSLLELQKFLEPKVEHVMEIKEEKKTIAEKEGQGEKDNLTP